jgi:hypothetical protein
MKLHSRALCDLDEDRVYPVDSAVLLQSKLGVTVIKSLVPPCRGIWASDIPIVQKIDEDEMCSYIALTAWVELNYRPHAYQATEVE